MSHRVLLAEDEAIVALAERAKLERLGYQVVAHVTTGRRAVEQAAECCPDMVLMDIELRGDMDGIEAARLIRARENIPVVFITAHSDERYLLRACEVRPSGFILKPFSESTLRANIEIALYNHEAQVELERSERRLREVTASLAEGLLVFDRSGRLTHMNPEAERLLGWPEAELLGRDSAVLLERICPHPESDCTLIEALRCGSAFRNQEDLMRRRDGQVFPVRLSVAPLTRAGGTDGVVVTFEDVTEHKRQEEELIRLATRDALTGVYNRSELMRMLRAELERALRYRRPLALFLLDIDDFKPVNDCHGHAVGDQVLCQFAGLIEASIRSTDFLGRYGGEEFVVVLPETGGEEAAELARRLVQRVAADPLLRVDETDIRLTISLGMAWCPEDAGTVDGLLGSADHAMYRAKRAGKNRIMGSRDPADPQRPWPS